MTRYLVGLVIAFLLFGLTCVLGLVPIVLSRGQPTQILQFVSMWVVFGIPNLMLLAVVVGPAVLVGNRILNRRPSIAGAGIFGALAGLGFLILFWLMYREADESALSLVRFWRRVPGELLVSARYREQLLRQLAGIAPGPAWEERCLTSGCTRRRPCGSR